MRIRVLGVDDAPAFQRIRLSGLQECPTGFASSYEEECDTPSAAVVARLVAKDDPPRNWFIEISTIQRGCVWTGCSQVSCWRLFACIDQVVATIANAFERFSGRRIGSVGPRTLVVS